MFEHEGAAKQRLPCLNSDNSIEAPYDFSSGLADHFNWPFLYKDTSEALVSSSSAILTAGRPLSSYRTTTPPLALRAIASPCFPPSRERRIRGLDPSISKVKAAPFSPLTTMDGNPADEASRMILGRPFLSLRTRQSPLFEGFFAIALKKGRNQNGSNLGSNCDNDADADQRGCFNFSVVPPIPPIARRRFRGLAAVTGSSEPTSTASEIMLETRRAFTFVWTNPILVLWSDPFTSGLGINRVPPET